MSHPDLIRSHEIMFQPENKWKKSYFEPFLYNDSTTPNPYMSSNNMTTKRDHEIKKNRIQKNTEPLKDRNLKKFDLSTDDSLVYQCSHPDDYEAVGSHLSSNTSQVDVI